MADNLYLSERLIFSMTSGTIDPRYQIYITFVKLYSICSVMLLSCSHFLDKTNFPKQIQ